MQYTELIIMNFFYRELLYDFFFLFYNVVNLQLEMKVIKNKYLCFLLMKRSTIN